VTGPVVDDHPGLPHWNDAPTGQVPAILDSSTGEEQAVAPPMWREEETDWEAQEEVFEPSMLSDDLPAVGALLSEQSEVVDVERQPWHFESDDTLVIPPEPGFEPFADLAREPVSEPEPLSLAEPPYETEFEPAEVSARVASSETAAAAAAAASRLTPPEPPEPKPRATRSTRSRATVRTGNVSTAGTGGRDMRVAIGSGVLLGAIALVCFAAGTVASMVIVCVVVLLATAEAYAAFRRAQYHPATLLGLVAVLSLLIETYNKGVAALPLVLVLLVAGSFVWYLARVEPAAEPVSGIASTVFVFVWVGAFGSFAALLLDPNLFPDRHGIAFLLAAVIVTVADDVASLLVGAAMGRHQLAPSISPNKSWEGLIGGAVAAILVSVIVVHFIHPWTIGKAALYGVVVAVVAPLGDLSQSMIKRHLGLKDMGRLLPGHGGILDRVDGLLFVIPATYFVVKAMHLG
jgi:phosphatidate cytidylyltransferase